MSTNETDRPAPVTVARYLTKRALELHSDLYLKRQDVALAERELEQVRSLLPPGALDPYAARLAALDATGLDPDDLRDLPALDCDGPEVTA